MRDIFRLLVAFWPVTLIVLTALMIFCAGWYYIKWKPDANFCTKYFPDVTTYECVLSNKYKYDGK